MDEPALIFGELRFFDAPSEIEGSPYWVDLWASVNGYRIGLQVKPRTYRSASVAMYAGKAMASQKRGHERFEEEFGGKVIHCTPTYGQISDREAAGISSESERLCRLSPGPHEALA